ncbi:hypothetical protein OQA88_816 [Cercophora sp. LCS_1]
MAITTAITDLFSSVYELFASLIGAAYTIVHSFVAGIASLFAGFFAFIADIFQGVFDIVGGVGKFVTGNIVILGIIGAGVYGYLHFTRQGQLQGQRSTAVKKTN